LSILLIINWTILSSKLLVPSDRWVFLSVYA